MRENGVCPLFPKNKAMVYGLVPIPLWNSMKTMQKPYLLNTTA